jgi:hypothetical protein
MSTGIDSKRYDSSANLNLQDELLVHLKHMMLHGAAIGKGQRAIPTFDIALWFAITCFRSSIEHCISTTTFLYHSCPDTIAFGAAFIHDR